MICLPYPECREHFRKVSSTANEMGLRKEWLDGLYYLHTYANREGCMCDKLGGRGNTRACLYPDFAPLSFAVSMQRQDSDGNWKPWFGGGLIYQGPDVPANGSFPSLTVSMDSTRVGWFLHT